MTSAGPKEGQLRALRETRAERKTKENTVTTKTKTTQTKRGKTQSAKAAKPLDGAVKRAAPKAKRTKVPGVDRSPLTVGTFIARAGGASMAEMEAQFKMDAHPLRAKIHAARHQLGFAIEYDAEKGRYFGKEPKHKATGKAAA